MASAIHPLAATTEIILDTEETPVLAEMTVWTDESFSDPAMSNYTIEVPDKMYIKIEVSEIEMAGDAHHQDQSFKISVAVPFSVPQTRFMKLGDGLGDYFGTGCHFFTPIFYSNFFLHQFFLL